MTSLFCEIPLFSATVPFHLSGSITFPLAIFFDAQHRVIMPAAVALINSQMLCSFSFLVLIPLFCPPPPLPVCVSVAVDNRGAF